VAGADDKGDDDADDRCQRSEGRCADKDERAALQLQFRFNPLWALLGGQDQLTLQPPPVSGIRFHRDKHQPELLGQIQELLSHRG
jgi:hypothetical protein